MKNQGFKNSLDTESATETIEHTQWGNNEWEISRYKNEIVQIETSCDHLPTDVVQQQDVHTRSVKK